MKKICFVTPIYLPANLFGSDNYVRVIAEELSKKKFDVSIITSDAISPNFWYGPFEKKVNVNYEIIHKVKVYRLRCNQLYFLISYFISRYGFFLPRLIRDRFQLMSSGPYLMGLDRLMQKLQPDTVHCSPAPLNINMQTVEAIKKMKKKPIFIFTPFFHSHVPIFSNLLMRYLFHKADKIHVISNAEKKEIIGKFNISENKFSTIPLFLNIKSMHSYHSHSIAVIGFKKNHNLENRIIILFAGIKGRMKGAVDLVYVVNELYKKDKKYILITIGHNTIEWEEAKKNINKNCLVDLGYVSEKEKEILFSCCDIFCMPSESETLGLVYLEAWHKKKPVVAANIPTVKELIGKDGLLVEFGNRFQLQEALETLSNNELKMKQLGKAGSKKFMKCYTYSNVFPKYISLFTE